MRTFQIQIRGLLLLLGLVGLVAAGCTSEGMPISGGAATSDSSLLEVSFTLQVGDEREIPGTTLRLGFLGVLEDSRCPIDVECVWAGDAEVQLSLTTATGVRELFTLHTNLEPHAAVVGGAHIELVGLRPLPRESQEILPGSYTVELELDAGRSGAAP